MANKKNQESDLCREEGIITQMGRIKV
ncbi:uncharacterized protein G2W53_000456 [Senna tora]|uniref:Uncharacterized protein n=1 Tax=Senna tora TaxID=362788 RepID=A0A835CHP0_9FABA|nr:uncharacterized protein G2W53_000456 [Senna tora]